MCALLWLMKPSEGAPSASLMLLSGELCHRHFSALGPSASDARIPGSDVLMLRGWGRDVSGGECLLSVMPCCIPDCRSCADVGFV